MSDLRAAIEQGERLSRDADETTLGVFEEELVDALRSLLAATEPGAGEREESRCTLCDYLIPLHDSGLHAVTTNVFILCGKLRAQPPRPAQVEEGPAARKLRHLVHVYGCGDAPRHGPEDCSWCEAAALLAGIKWDEEPRPAQDAVREAAERLREAFPNYTAMSADCDCPTCLTMRLLSALDARRRG